MLTAATEIKSQGEREFLDRLYCTYYPMLYNLVSGIIQDRTEVNDVIIDAMLSLFDKVPKLQAMDETKRIAYVRKTVRNAAYKHYNTQKSRNLTEFPVQDYIFSLPDTEQSDPAADLIKNEDIQLVRKVVGSLPLKDRQALYLKYAVGLTTREIAQMTDAPSEAAVYERLARARHKVVSLLRKWGWDDEG